MPIRPLKPNRRGSMPSASELNRLQATMQKHDRISGGRNTRMANMATGIMIADTSPHEFRARITGAPGGPGGDAYPFQEVFDDGAGNFEDNLNGLSGTVAGSQLTTPAYEENGLTSVATGTIVWLRPAADGASFLFSFNAGAGGTSGPPCCSGFTGTKTLVTSVVCSAGVLTVTTQIFTWQDGLLKTVV